MSQTQTDSGVETTPANTDVSPQDFRVTRDWHHISEFNVDLIAKCIEACVSSANKEYVGPSQFLNNSIGDSVEELGERVSIMTGTSFADERLVKSTDMYNTVPGSLVTLTDKVRSIQHSLNQWVQKYGDWKKTFSLSSLEIKEDLLAFDRFLRGQGTKAGWLRPGIYLAHELGETPDDFTPNIEHMRERGRWWNHKFCIVLPPITLSTNDNPNEQDKSHELPAMAMTFNSDWIQPETSYVPNVIRLFMPGENEPRSSEHFHPNISGSGTMCLGDGMTNFVNMIQTGQFTGAMEVAYSVVSSYGYQNPYATLTNIFEYDDDLQEYFCIVNGESLGEWGENDDPPDDVRWLDYPAAGSGYSHEDNCCFIEAFQEYRHDEHVVWDEFTDEYAPLNMSGHGAMNVLTHVRRVFQPEYHQSDTPRDMVTEYRDWLQREDSDLYAALMTAEVLEPMSDVDKEKVQFETISVARGIPGSDWMDGRRGEPIWFSMDRGDWCDLTTLPCEEDDLLYQFSGLVQSEIDEVNATLTGKLRVSVLNYIDGNSGNTYPINDNITMFQAVFGHFLFKLIQERLKRNEDTND